MGTKTFANLITAVGRLGHWSVSDSASDSYGHASYACEAGLVRIEALGAFKWLEALGSITLVAGTYEYAISTDAFRLDAGSFRPAESGEDGKLVCYANRRGLDSALGPKWRDSATSNGSPSAFARTGNNVWIGPKPSATYVADHPTVEYFYIRHEATSGTLYLPNTFFTCAVHASLAEGLKQKDSKLQGYYEQLFETVDKQRLLGTPLLIGTRQNIRGSALAEDLLEFEEFDGYV